MKSKTHTVVSTNLVRLFLAFFAVLISICMSTTSVHAITRGYSTDDMALKPGSVVSLSSDNPSDDSKVERASRETARRVIGVATTVSDSLVTIASGSQGVFVETDGEVVAFASNLNGDIKQGDLLSVSPLRGVLMKHVPGEVAVAIALEDFSREDAEAYSVDNGDDGTTETLVDKIRINLDQKAAANQIAESDSSLAKLGRAVVGKDVGEIRVIIALIIFFIVLIAEGGIIYGAVSSAITSLGRNPLARNIIKQELVRVLFVAIVVLSVGLGAIYAVLWI